MLTSLFCLSCIVGSAGLTVASQIRERFRSAGKALAGDDIAILDAADYHYYQVRVCLHNMPAALFTSHLG